MGVGLHIYFCEKRRKDIENAYSTTSYYKVRQRPPRGQAL